MWYGDQRAEKHLGGYPRRQITAIVGPSGCGKSTLLKSLNRLAEIGGARISGRVLLDGVDIYDPAIDVTSIRARVGLLAQKPCPLPLSIYDNVAYGPRIHGLGIGRLDDLVRAYLQAAELWDEVKDRLKAPATGLSLGQQQRLSGARWPSAGDLAVRQIDLGARPDLGPRHRGPAERPQATIPWWS